MKFAIKTFGCQMNVYDSERIIEILQNSGYILNDDPVKSEIYIINTCSVREKPRQRVVNLLNNIKSRNKKVIKIVCGCVAQLEGGILLKNGANLIIGPDWYSDFPEIIKNYLDTGKDKIYTDRIIDDYNFLIAQPGESGVSAFVPIQKGCDNWCTYCVVPAARGPEKSRPQNLIIDEVNNFVSAGAKEIYLLGQNVNSYKVEGGFSGLLEKIAQISGVQRIRFTTSHPKDLSPQLIETIRNVPQIMPWFHLPVQSGSNEILKLMNRGYTNNQYRNLIESLRKAVPDIAITTDIIVGFPYESERDFEDTYKLVNDVRYEGVFSFKYSERPNTKAEKMEQISENIKSERLKKLQNLYENQLPETLKKYVGNIYKVLVEGVSLRNKKEAKGRIPQNHIVNFQLPPDIKPDDLVGRIVDVKITEVRTHTLYGFYCAN
jgi:tRNA-2-methylthio-N6-dimethylallyladenosine synthase